MASYSDFRVLHAVVTPRGGGEFYTNGYTGKLRLEVQPLTLLYTIYPEKGTPFIHRLLTNGTPFTYLV